MQTGTEDDGIEQVDGENSVNRRTFVQGVGMLPLSTSLLDNEEARQQLDLGNSAHGSGRTRRFTIHAIEVDIVYNRFGLHQPNGVMYVLDENLDAVREASGETPDDAFSLVENETASAEQRGNPNEDDGEVDTSLIEPLVIRANEGDTIQIRFVNHLDRQASIHQTALPYNVQTSDGMAVGLNPDTTAKPGERSSTAGRPHIRAPTSFTTGRIRRSTVPTSRQRRRTCYPGDCSGLSRSNRRERRGATLRPAANSTVVPRPSSTTRTDSERRIASSFPSITRLRE